MNKHVVKRVAAVVIFTTAVTVFIGNGCSGEFSAITDSASNSGLGTEAPDNGITLIPGTKTASLVYANQVLTHLTSCAGVARPSDATVAMYEAKKGSISVYGTANTVTAPMMMAITSISGEVCNDLINQEIASGGRIFMDINLAANAPGSQTALTSAISRLALSCWQRNESAEERDMLLRLVNENVGATEAGAAKKAALMLCTSVLSSLDALLN